MQKTIISTEKIQNPALLWFLHHIGQGFLLILALITAIVLGINIIQTPTLFAQMVITGLQLGFVYALIALGYTMVYGIVKLINFAHGDIFMVGSFVSFYAITHFNLHRWPANVFPGMNELLVVVIGTLTVILLSMLVCVLLAITIERVAYKPLRDAPRIAALITAIGVSFFLEYFGALNFVFSPRFIPYQRPFEVVTVSLAGGEITFSNIAIIIMVASILVQFFSSLLSIVQRSVSPCALPPLINKQPV